MPLDKTFSKGNFWSIVTTILSAGGVIVAITLAWSDVGSQADENTRGVEVNRTAIQAAEIRLRALEQSSAVADERYGALHRSLEEARADIRQLLNEFRAERDSSP